MNMEESLVNMSEERKGWRGIYGVIVTQMTGGVCS
jgi:hypothetical protein